MGGTNIKLGLIKDGVIITRVSLPASSHLSLATRLADMSISIDALLEEHQAQPIGIGIAFPGIIDSVHLKVLSEYVKYPDAQDFDFRQWATEKWGIPLALENDAKAALIGEWQFGNGRQSKDLVLITLGTGVGSAVMIDGRVLSGRNFIAGNLGGHMTINLHGNICNCGNVGCLETEGSTWALANAVKNIDNDQFVQSSLSKESNHDFKVLFDHASNGDALAAHIRDKCLKAWSLGIINLIHAFDPERVVIGGGVMESHHLLLPHIARMIASHSWVKRHPPELVVAAHPQTAGMLGMYHIVKQAIKERTQTI